MDEIQRMKQFGIAISNRRQELGLSLEEVGKAFGATKQAVSQIETGKNKDLKGNTLFGLMKVLKWSPEQLYAAWRGSDPSQLQSSDPEFILGSIESMLQGRKPSR